jgi:hypothetical protein
MKILQRSSPKSGQLARANPSRRKCTGSAGRRNDPQSGSSEARERFLAPSRLSSYDCCVMIRGFIAVCALCAAACSETASEKQGPPRDAGSDVSTDSNSLDAGSEGGDLGTGDGGLILVEPACPATPPTCPSLAPSEGMPCVPLSNPLLSLFLCEYGDDPVSDCNTVAYCENDSTWHVQSPTDAGLCPTALPAACPPSFADALDSGLASEAGLAFLEGGTACPTATLSCSYSEGTCACESGYLRFICTSPPGPTCPATRPRYGTPCSSDAGSCNERGGQFCNGPWLEAETVCECSSWQPFRCPPPP